MERSESELDALSLTPMTDEVETISGIINSKLNCSICNNVVIDCSVLTCGHMFCSFCLRLSLSSVKSCPSCGVYSDFYVATRSVDNFVNKLLEIVHLESNAIRQQASKDRSSINTLELQEEEETTIHQDAAQIYYPEWIVPAVGQTVEIPGDDSFTGESYNWYTSETMNTTDFIEWEAYILADEDWDDNYDYP